jgi:enoyl-CoA hydratase/carnithine racemase
MLHNKSFEVKELTSTTDWADVQRSPSLRILRDRTVGIIELARPQKRNALNRETIEAIRASFETLPDDIRAVVIRGAGDHFCAGLDLSEAVEWSMIEGMRDSRAWHKALECVERGRVPVVVALQGAVVGGGLELAAAGHVRVADESVFYALPEGQRGIFLGGGGSVRLPRLIGTARVMDMMLTGRTYDARGGEAIGLSQYVVPRGESFSKALELAHKIAANAPLSNYAVVQALPHIAESGPQAGYFTEALMASIAQNDPEAKRRLGDFLEKRGAKVRHTGHTGGHDAG